MKLDSHSHSQGVLKLWRKLSSKAKSQLKTRAKRFESILDRLPATGLLIQELIGRLRPANSFAFGLNCPNLPTFSAEDRYLWTRREVSDSHLNCIGMVALLHFVGSLNCSEGYFLGENDPVLRNILLALTRLRESVTDEHLSGAYVLTQCDSIVGESGCYHDGLELLLFECTPAYLIDATAAAESRLADEGNTWKLRDERLLSAILELFTARPHEATLPSFFRLAEVSVKDLPTTPAANRDQELALKWTKLSETKKKIVRAAKEDVAELQKEHLDNAELDPESSYNRTLHKGLCDTGFIIEDNDGRFRRAPGLPILD